MPIVNWRGTTTTWRDRLFGALVYALPLVDVVGFGGSIFRELPFLTVLYVPLLPLLQLYQIPFMSFIIFLVLFLLVVRNSNISYFIRFNTMQSILISILVSLCGLVIQYIFQPIGGFVVQTLASTVFLGVVVAAIYSIVQSALGRLAEIPSLSEAVHMQVR